MNINEIAELAGVSRATVSRYLLLRLLSGGRDDQERRSGGRQRNHVAVRAAGVAGERHGAQQHSLLQAVRGEEV